MDERHLSIRRAEPDEARLVAEVWIRSRREALPLIPPPVHNDDEVRTWFDDVIVPMGDTWVVVDGREEIVGVLVLDEGWIDQLYIDPAHTGRGLGSRIIDFAKVARPEGLDLWTFQTNVPARRFYERHGFVAVDETDGDNEEGAPDVRYHWSGWERLPTDTDGPPR